MGDRIDLRVLTRVDDSYRDVSNCGFQMTSLDPDVFGEILIIITRV